MKKSNAYDHITNVFNLLMDMICLKMACNGGLQWFISIIANHMH